MTLRVIRIPLLGILKAEDKKSQCIEGMSKSIEFWAVEVYCEKSF